MNDERYVSTVDRAAEWDSPLAILVSGLLLLETLTGLAITFLPFSFVAQVSVLVHTIASVGFAVLYVVYQIRHWRVYQPALMSHFKLTGYFSLASAAVCGASGIVVMIQALFLTRISHFWDRVHLVSTFALIAAIVPHVTLIITRDRKARGAGHGTPVGESQKRFGQGVVLVTTAGVCLVGLWTYGYDEVKFKNEFPADYNYKYGRDRPFGPSLATTSDSGAFDARSISGSLSCGTARCHDQIVREWQPSAHRYSAMDPAFQAVQAVMGKQNSPESTRYCGGCHDPISLFSGAKNVFSENLTNLAGYQEGVSCLVCHSIRKTDIKGNANYVIVQPPRYMYELKQGTASRFLRDFLIRAYPRQHTESLSHRLFKSPEFCAACHKQFIDAEINNVGWVQLQNQYDNWRKSRWNHGKDAARTIECRECHMPLVDGSREPAAGDDLDYNRSASDGKHRSHRFLGANQFMPKLLALPGADEHHDLTVRWLRGEIPVNEIAHKWREGPATPIELVAPDRVAPGEQTPVRVVITNNKVGHDFPTGPLDIIQSWVELTVTDDSGGIVYKSGDLDTRHFIKPGSFIFKAEAVDQYGNLIDRHNLWEMVGVRFRRSVFPGFADAAGYSFPSPPDSPGRMHVNARLLYRKIDQFLLNFLMGETSGLTATVSSMAEDTKTILIVRR